MHPLITTRGYRLVTPTYTGLGEREHLASPSNDLETHIQDMLGVIKYEDLNDIVLVGHSYGGMVATGVADRARDRIAQLIYLDAFVPRDGQCLLDLFPTEQRHLIMEAVKAGDGWRLPPNPMPPDTSEEGFEMDPGASSPAIGQVRSNAVAAAQWRPDAAAQLHSLHTGRRPSRRYFWSIRRTGPT